jgi:hypothetical protein
VQAFCIVLAEFEALVVLIAPMLGKFVALDAEVVVAANRRRVVGAAVETELADVATLLAFVAVAALVADEVSAEVVVALRADIVVAMFAAVLAQSAVFAKLAFVEAFAAIGADVVVPVRTVGTEFMLAVIVCLAIGAEAAVLAFFILRACSALGAEMVFVVGGSDAVAMFATLRLAVVIAAIFAKLAVGAKFDAGSFGALAALRTFPVVLFAAMYAMLAAKLTPDHFVAEAGATLGAVFLVGSTALAESAFVADIFVATETFAAVDEVLGRSIFHARIADSVFHTGIALHCLRLFSVDDHADAAPVALHFAAVRAVSHYHRVFAVAL